MALASRAALLDVVAKLEVLSQESGCLLDLSAILDLSVCPKIDIFLPRPHHVKEEKKDVVCVTPTEGTPTKAVRSSYDYKPSGWCPKRTVNFDLLSLVALDLTLAADLELYLSILHLDLDLDLDILLGKRGYSAPSGPSTGGAYTPGSAGGKGPKSGPKTPALLGIDIDLDLDVNAIVDLSLELDVDIHLDGRKVRKAEKHFKPACGKKLPEPKPDNGCHKITAPTATDCMARCHSHAAALTLDARAKVGQLADVVDCTAISFDRGLTVDNCLYAHVDVLGLVMVDAKVDTLIRI
jgi:hypothetical protein